jgi:hypothetical protein
MYSNFFIYYEKYIKKSKLIGFIITIMFIKVGMSDGEQFLYSIKEKIYFFKSSLLKWLKRD